MTTAKEQTATEQLAEDGLAGPFDLADLSILESVCEVAVELQRLQRQQNVLANLSGQPDLQRHTTPTNRHMVFVQMQHLFGDANLQAVVAECFGIDLVLWQTKFFPKYPGVGENRWHHDHFFQSGNEPLRLFDTSNHFSFVIALTDFGLEDGRLEYIRGSHRPIEGFDRDMPRIFDDMPGAVHERITPLPMQRGQFAVFHSMVLHRSLAYGHKEADWRPEYFGAPNPELRRNANVRDGRISVAARLTRKDTIIPERFSSNPAGVTRAIAEPIPYYDDDSQIAGDRSVVMPFN